MLMSTKNLGKVTAALLEKETLEKGEFEAIVS